MINLFLFFRKLIFCRLWNVHKPNKKFDKLYRKEAVCKYCKHTIKRMTNGEWVLWP